MIVLKFGGTSTADAAAITRGAEIVRGRMARQPIVVVSALAGTTNGLIAIAEQSARGHLIGAMSAVESLRARHLAEADALLGDAAADVAGEMSALFDELAHLAEALSVLGDLTPRSLDAISAMGEQLSSLLVAAAYHRLGLPAVHVDSRDVMVTDATFGRAEPQPDAIAAAARAHLLPLVRAGKIPVLGGYFGATETTRITTTLGRGGSDYSASLVGAAVQAEAIEIWTDVDGMLTADPRVVPDARLIERIGFDEASELASFGAKVLHPFTIAPAVRKGIPVVVLNSRRPEGAGTFITFDAPRRAVTALAGKEKVTLVRVTSPRMLLTEGFLRTLFAVFERHRTSVDVVATSEVSVSVTIDDASRLDGLVSDLRELGDVAIERNRGVIAVVGADLSRHPATMAAALAALDGVAVHMLSLSASGINLTIVIDGERVNTVMQRLHATFFPGCRRMTHPSLRVALVGMGRMGRAIAALAPERGVEIVARIDRDDMQAGVTADSLGGADAAIEFTEPDAVVGNIERLVGAGCPVVVGTTGWDAHRERVERLVSDRGGALLHAANFSIGVNVFAEIVAEASRRFAGLAGFDAHLVETHHTAKKDAPSGTALMLARAAGRSDLPITSVRVGSVPGTHEVVFDAAFETVSLTHVARDRRVFADGALVAARWLVGRRGVFTMQDVLRDIPSPKNRS